MFFASLMLNHLMCCTILIWLIYPLDHVHAEPKSVIQDEQSLGECSGTQAISCVDTNLALNQYKPQSI
jgi:hypothetical protein